MADERKPIEKPVDDARPEAAAKEVEDRKVTDNPGEGTHMFKDWALI